MIRIDGEIGSDILGREKALIAVIIMLSLVIAGLSFYLCQQHSDLEILRGNYYSLRENYAILQEDHETLESEYDVLELEHGTLESKYTRLSSTYEEMSLLYEALEESYASLESELVEKDNAISKLMAQMEILQQMAEEAGVEIHYDTVVTGVLLKSGEIHLRASPDIALAVHEGERRDELLGVLAATPTGAAVFEARVFIDSTGDGDVAAMAGAVV